MITASICPLANAFTANEPLSKDLQVELVIPSKPQEESPSI